MSRADRKPRPPAPALPAPALDLMQPPQRAYALLCLAGLGGVFLAEIEQGAGAGNFLILLVGLLGLSARLRSAPLLYLLVLAIQQIVQQRPGFGPFAVVEVSDVVLCGSVLVYVVAHYRLQGLVRNVVPLDPRRREGPPRWNLWRFYWLPRLALERRSPHGVSIYEVPVLLLTLPPAALTAELLWAQLRPPQAVLNFPAPLWRLLLIAWGLGVGLLLAAAANRQWKRRQMAPEEAVLLLQDVLWTETRREQRRINRWLAWAHLRDRQRKELS